MKKIGLLLVMLMLVTLAIGGCGRLSDSGAENSDVRDVVKDRDDQDLGGTVKDPSGNEDKDPPKKSYDYHNWVPVCKADGGAPLYGYADPDGNMLIEPQFGFADPFYDCGLAQAGREKYRFGLINDKGEYVVEPFYDYIIYTGGLFLASKDGETKAYDEKGQLKFTTQNGVGYFSEGLAEAYGKGYINTNGDLVLDLSYSTLRPFHHGMAIVGKDYAKATWYIDTEGNDLTDKVSSGLRLVYDEASSRFGYADKDGKMVIDYLFSEAEPFLDGLAIVNVASEDYTTNYGIINTKGEFVLGPHLTGIKRMLNGTFAVGALMTTEEYIPFGYFDSTPKALYTKDLSKNTDIAYSVVQDFNSDILCVNDGKVISFLDADLEPAKGFPKINGRGALEADGDVLRGNVDAVLSVYDKKGNPLMQDHELTLLGDGITSTTAYYMEDHTTLAYPVLDGFSDNRIEEKLNLKLAEEMVNPWSGNVMDSEDDEAYFYTEVNTWFFSQRLKDLYVTDQIVDMYPMGAAHGSHYRSLLFLNFKTGDSYGFDDLFKSPDETRKRISQIITDQINADTEDSGYMVDEVTPEQIQCFALSPSSIIFYFAEYEIGPYAMGMPEFEIPFADIQDLINTEGAFWKSFN